MRSYFFSKAALLAVTSLGLVAGCGGAVIEPGHRALRFDPKQGGLQHEVLQPGYHALHCGPFSSVCPRVDDFDVTYSTRKEEITTNSKEGLAINMRVAVVYRPIIAELYQLDTEIGPNYYDEVIAPEFRSAARSVLARHSYQDLHAKNEGIENEIETELRRRASGKHVEISSVLLESFEYAPEIAAANRARIVSEQEAARQTTLMNNAAAAKKRQMEIAAEEQRMATEARAAQEKLDQESATQLAEAKLAADTKMAEEKLQAETQQKELEIKLQTEEETQQLESALRTKENERKVAEQEAQIAKLKADGEAAARVAAARGEAQARLALAAAAGEEKKAEAQALTPMHVMMHAYDALAHLGGSGTTIMLGDWSHVPSFLFPRVPAFQSAFTLPWSPYAAAPGAAPPVGPTSYSPPAATGTDPVFASTAGR